MYCQFEFESDGEGCSIDLDFGDGNSNTEKGKGKSSNGVLIREELLDLNFASGDILLMKRLVCHHLQE